MAGTCGAAWNSLFVPRKLSSSHHDFLIPQKCYFSAEDLGWRAPAVRLGTRFSFCENFYLHTTTVLYREKVTLIGREIRVAVPNFSR